MELRRLPIGAEFTRDGVSFRIWAPSQNTLSIQVERENSLPLKKDADGYFCGSIPGLRSGARYRIRLDSGELIADPASRFQPEGPHGPSQVVDPLRFTWTDEHWVGRKLEDYVIYEMHVGTFTSDGTWLAAAGELPELAAIGITCIEVMPIAEFPGRWGWGYDGVGLFAPWHSYGVPDDFRKFVDLAHQAGICVILDVVYNHVGPDGNNLAKLSADYFSSQHHTDWGVAINFDGPNCEPVREFFLSNAEYWIKEFHLDGLRLDATQDIHDNSPPERHLFTEIGQRVRAAAPGRTKVLIAENEPQHSELCRPLDQSGHGLDALWNDDFHHAAMVALNGRREAYYTDYRGDPQEFVSAAKYGYLYQGQWYSWQSQRRGRPAFDLAPSQFVTFIQNHDQIANSCSGLRAHQVGSPGRYRALTALTLLGLGTPMLFQGQEFAASTPFLYFADHNPKLARMVAKGRREFLAQFPSLSDPTAQRQLHDPGDPNTFLQCKLDFTERESHAQQYQLTKDLLKIRQAESCFRADHRLGFDGAVLGPQAFVLRYFLDDGQDRLLLVNLGREMKMTTVPEPLLGCPPNHCWQLVLSTESLTYGGAGFAPVEKDGWQIPAEAAVFMKLAIDIDNQTERATK